MKVTTALPPHIDAALEPYLECVLWSELDRKGEPLNRRYTRETFSSEAIESAIADLEKFFALAGNAVEAAQMAGELQETRLFQPSHIWLTRNGHGTGFWDVQDMPHPLREALAIAAKKLGECNVYEGDDGLLYFSS